MNTYKLNETIRAYTVDIGTLYQVNERRLEIADRIFMRDEIRGIILYTDGDYECLRIKLNDIKEPAVIIRFYASRRDYLEILYERISIMIGRKS